jgi:hypothetical protein
MTISDLRPNSQDTSAFYLAQMYLLLAHINASSSSIPVTVVQPPAFSPPRYAVWVNSLWFLSFLINITYAMLAMMLHQWAGRYIMITQQLRHSPQRKARIRAFFSDAVHGFPVLLVVEALRVMIHLSLFLFFAGLTIFLYNINRSVFGAAVWWMGLSTMAYMCITFLPIFRPNSPYYTPLSSTIWFFLTGMQYAIYVVLSLRAFNTGGNFDAWKRYYHRRLIEGMGKTAEETAWQQSSKMDVRVLISTLDDVGEDDCPEEVFKAVPGFFNSEQVNDLEEPLLDEFRTKFRPKLNRFLDRIFSSNSVSGSEPVRSDQFITCLNATHAVLGPDGVSQILYDVLSGRWGEVSSVEMGHSLRDWDNNNGDEFTPFVRRIITQIIISIRERDERWISLVVGEFGVSDHTLRANIRHGDSALLSLLIHVTHQATRSNSLTPFTLASLTKFDICEALPELRHEFCSLWNKILRDARRDGVDSTAIKILREIRHAYIELHKGTDAAPTAFSARTFYYNPILAKPLSYRFCNIAHHRRASAPSSAGASNPSVARSTVTAQRAGSPNPSYSPSSLQSQRLSNRSDGGHVAHTAQPQAEQASINPLTPSDAVLPGLPAQTLSQRRTFRSISPSAPPMQVAPQVNSTDGRVIHESIRLSTVHEKSLDRHLPASMEIPSYPQHPALSSSDIVASGARPHELKSHTYPRETEDATEVLSTTSLTSSHPDPHLAAGTSSADLRVHSFSQSDQVHTESYPTDEFPPIDTPGSRPEITVGATTSHPLESGGHPIISREKIATLPAATFIGETTSTTNPVHQSVPVSRATLQGNEENSLPPPIRLSDSQSSLPLQYDDTPISAGLDSAAECVLKPPDPFSCPLGSTSPSPTTPLSYNSLQVSPVQDVNATTSLGSLVTPDQTRDPFPPILMQPGSPLFDDEDPCRYANKFQL